MNCILLYVVAY